MLIIPLFHRFVKGALRWGPSYGVTIVKPNGEFQLIMHQTLHETMTSS